MAAGLSEAIENAQLFDLYVAVNDLARAHNVSLVVPRIAIFGQQSAGKTSFLELYAGIPLGFTATGTGTRCPVEYTFRNDPKATSPIVEINSKRVTQAQLIDDIKFHMETLAAREGFSDEILRITLTSAKVTNIVLTDTPGLIVSGSDPQVMNRVKRIVQKIVRDPNYALVAILKCSESHETVSDIEILNTMMNEIVDQHEIPPPRSNWEKEAVMVVNNINKFLDEKSVFPDSKTASKWLKDQQPRSAPGEVVSPRFFVVLKPDKNFIRERASYAELQEFIEQQPHLESQQFETWKRSLMHTGPWDSSVDRFLGAKNARTETEKLFFEAFKKQIPIISQAINHRIDEERLNGQNLEMLAEKLDPDRYQATLRKYAADYANHLAAFIQAEMRRTERGKDIFGQHDDNSFVFRPSTYGKAWDEELELHQNPHVLDWANKIIPLVDLRRKLALQDLGTEMNARLVGAASMQRAMKVVSYYVYSTPMIDVDEDSILSIAAGNGNINTFPNDKIISILARAQLRNVEGGYKFLRSHILGTASSYSEIVRDFLLGQEYQHIANDPIVLALCLQMSREYMQLLDEQLKEVGRRIQQSVMMYSRYLRADLPVRTTMMVLANPMQDRVLDEKASVPKNFDHKKAVDNHRTGPAEADINVTKERDGAGVKSGATWLPWSSDSGSSSDGYIPTSEEQQNTAHDIANTTQYHHADGTVVLGAVRPTGANAVQIDPPGLRSLNDRNSDKRRVMEKFIALAWKNHKNFNFADISEGMELPFLPGSATTVQYEYLKACAKELYTHVMFWMIFDAEMAMENYVISYLPTEGTEELKLRFQNLIASLTKEDIAKNLGASKEMIEKQTEESKSKMRALELAKVKLEQAKHSWK